MGQGSHVVRGPAAHPVFEIPLNVEQQWQALIHNGTDNAALNAYLRSPNFVVGATYRVLRGADGRIGMYWYCSRAVAWIPRCSPKALAIRSFADPPEYASLLCERRVDQIIHFDSYDWGRHTNEVATIAALEDAAGRRRAPRSPRERTLWKVDAVDRSGCPGT